jgi:hypothetical protein
MAHHGIQLESVLHMISPKHDDCAAAMPMGAVKLADRSAKGWLLKSECCHQVRSSIHQERSPTTPLPRPPPPNLHQLQLRQRQSHASKQARNGHADCWIQVARARACHKFVGHLLGRHQHLFDLAIPRSHVGIGLGVFHLRSRRGQRVARWGGQKGGSTLFDVIFSLMGKASTACRPVYFRIPLPFLDLLLIRACIGTSVWLKHWRRRLFQTDREAYQWLISPQCEHVHPRCGHVNIVCPHCAVQACCNDMCAAS